MYIKSILAVGILCAVADTLMPEGPVKGMGKLVCGMALLCTVLMPVAELDLTGAGGWLERYFHDLDGEELRLEKEINRQTKDIIEEECAAYILDKAAQHGINCRVEVTCSAGDEGIWLPREIKFRGTLSQSDRDILSRTAQEDLGIPLQRQSFADEGAAE